MAFKNDNEKKIKHNDKEINRLSQVTEDTQTASSHKYASLMKEYMQMKD